MRKGAPEILADPGRPHSYGLSPTLAAQPGPTPTSSTQVTRSYPMAQKASMKLKADAISDPALEAAPFSFTVPVKKGPDSI
jgi:hypothetical protein